ncbi:maltokinase N-terminal cap-like domain-containing protein, partial [Kribbia dieselivorans]|uniref:maltokinase N-terminal cap-like domain-containing protein n=1 Tax=Kribbia dieselivorans TaxID=331526 RepID=UPI000839689D
MALLYDATLTPGKLDLIAGWITGQRWYAGSSRGPLPVEQLRHVGRWRVDDPAGEVGCEVHLVADDSGVAAGGEPVIYQVPLTYRGAPLAGGEAALVGEMEHSVLGHRWVYDGCHDPVFAAELLGLTLGRVGAMSSTTSDAPEPDVVGHRHPDWGSELSVGSSRVLTGEQTNTSIVHTCTDASGAPVSVITKVFRVLAAGRNPDIELQGVLSAAGSTRVPRSVGHVTGRWRPENRDARPESSAAPLVDGDLTFTSVFLDGAVDAWRVTLALLRDGLPGIEERAAALAEATAEVHSVLAQRCLTRPVTDADVDAVIAGMQQRLAAAVAAAP